MQYASLRDLDTKAVRAEVITLALASLLTDAAERVALLGTGMRAGIQAAFEEANRNGGVQGRPRIAPLALETL